MCNIICILHALCVLCPDNIYRIRQEGASGNADVSRELVPLVASTSSTLDRVFPDNRVSEVETHVSYFHFSYCHFFISHTAISHSSKSISHLGPHTTCFHVLFFHTSYSQVSFSYFILPCVIPHTSYSYVSYSCFILPCLILPYLIPPCLIFPCHRLQTYSIWRISSTTWEHWWRKHSTLSIKRRLL